MNLNTTQWLAQTLMSDNGLCDWKFEFDHARRRGGQCRHRDRTITMSRHLVPTWTEEQVREILLHEIAHAMVGSGHGHDATWRNQYRALGGNGRRTHSNATVEAPWAAWCEHCGIVGYYHRRRALSCRHCWNRGRTVALEYRPRSKQNA